MFADSGILLSVIAVAAILTGLVVWKPQTATRGGKVLAFVSLFIFPVLSVTMGASDHLERSKSTAFCLKCHVMENFGKSLHIDDPTFLPAAHFQNNRIPRDQVCYTCHTDYTMYGGVRAKLRGLRHVYIQYFGKIPAPENISLYTPYNNRECLHCHLGARSFEEGATHNLEEGRLAAIKSNALSCVSSGCHGSVHNNGKVADMKMWPEENHGETK